MNRFQPTLRLSFLQRGSRRGDGKTNVFDSAKLWMRGSERIPRGIFLIAAASLLLAFGAIGEETKREVTEPMGEMKQPLAFGLDMASFNRKEGLIGVGEVGEILSRFDRFLRAQGISTVDWTSTDLKRIRGMVVRDINLSETAERERDSQYDGLKDRLKSIRKEIEKNPDGALLKEYFAIKKEADPFKDERNLLRDYLRVEKPILEVIDRATEYPDNARLQAEACNVALRAMYSLFAMQLMDERDGKGFNKGIDGLLRVAQLVVCRSWVNRIPFSGAGHFSGPIGISGAAKEAGNLVDPKDSSRFFSRSELATLSSAEVAALDLSPDDPMWHTHHRMETSSPDTWSEIEQWLGGKVTEELNESKKFRKANPDFAYHLRDARAVLFWDKIKTSATSPKINVTDAFEQDWKLKWGEECAIEPITNRLRLKLGAKYADLVYSDTDGDSHLLILCGEMQKRMNPGKLMPATEDEFVTGLLESQYQFNVKPFILSSGVITTANAGEVLRNLPTAALKGFRTKDLIGRTWVSFRESMVEVKHGVINRGGPIGNFTEFAAADRALRQSYMISLWLEETDCKEDNFRSAWMKNFAGNSGNQYFEFFHDAGSALGGVGRTGEINDLHALNGRRDFMWLGPLKRTVFCNSFQTFRPRIWDDVTFADGFSGVRHIARLTRSEIAEAVSYSGMPDYWQEAAVWKLASRRDTMARIFGLPAPDAAGEAPTIEIPLTTRLNRTEAARRYQLPLSMIEEDLIRAGALSADDPAADTREPIMDLVVRNGILEPYRKTILPAILRDFRHPPGFIKRMNTYRRYHLPSLRTT